MRTRCLTNGLWFVALLTTSMLAAATAPNSAIPERFVALIQADRPSDARRLAEREYQELGPDASTLQRCEALELIMVLFGFEPGAPDDLSARYAAQSLSCWQSLPGDRARAFAVARELRQARRLIIEGKYQEGLALEAARRQEFDALQRHLPSLQQSMGWDVIGNAAQWRDEPETAAQAFRKATDVLAGGAGAERIQQAQMLGVLALRLERAGQLAEAMTAIDRADSLIAPPFPAPKFVRATLHGRRATIAFFANRWDQALTHADAAIALFRPLGPSVNEQLALNLVTRSNALKKSGRQADALPPLVEAIALERGLPDQDMTGLAAHMNQLGALQFELNQIEAAEASFNESLALYRQALGAGKELGYPAAANLAAVLLARGNTRDARARMDAYVDRAEQQLGPDNERLPELLLEQGNYAYADHDYAAAEAIHQRALRLLPKVDGVLAAQRYWHTRSLARAQHGLGNDRAAFATAVSAERQRQQLLRSVGCHLGSDHAIALQHKLTGTLDMIHALVAADPDPKRIEIAWDLEIAARQSVARLIGARLQTARQTADAKTQSLWSAYEQASDAYTNATLSRASDQAAIARRREALDQAERALAQQVRAVAQALDPGADRVAALKSVLPRGSTLIAYVQFKQDPWQPENTAQTASEGRYYAYVLSASEPATLTDLGSGTRIEAAVARWQDALRDPRSSELELKQAGRALRRLVLDPLPIPTQLSRHYIVPAGDLYRVSWLPLPVADERSAQRLVDAGPDVQLLDSERELSVAAVTHTADSLLLVGAPALARNERNLTGCGLAELPGASAEIDALSNLWQPDNESPSMSVLVGKAAMEPAVRRAMQASRLLHFATHTLSSQACEPLLASRSVKLIDTTASKARPDDRGRGALVLSTPTKPAPKMNPARTDGLLTPEEVVTMDLSGVQSVVLSACDTGAGAVTPEEGAFGLRRAFRLAGARSVVMSLWPIDDAATAALMQAYYRERLQRRTEVPTALRAAAQAVIAERTAAGESVHPYYWAGFVASGDWR